MEIIRLHLASLELQGLEVPVHGFVVLHPKAGAVLVDSGVGGPERWLTDWRCVNRSIADVMSEHDLSPSDITMVVNTHLHFDHCGQNGVFRHAPFYIQRSELERARRESKALTDWFDFAGARYELLDGDAELAEGLRALATPGHTVGHQSVLVEAGVGEEVLIGDAAYTSGVYRNPDLPELPTGQASDRKQWERSLRHLHELRPARVHFCHDTRVVER